MKSSVVTRFAPSPTGYMHIGNLRTALYSYLIAKHEDGTFILRIEDTDRERLVEGAVELIKETLAVTGLDYDEGPDKGGDHGPYVQSERKPIYMEYAKKLVDMGAAYYCFCTKERLEALHEEDAVGGYDRHCRDLSPEEVEANLAAGLPFVIRQKMPLEGRTVYTDAVFGEIGCDNAELQDQILMKADGYPTYNFAHVVDDYLMGVTHVVRGSEYLTSTPKYALLYDAFGWERPTYVHLPLLMGKSEEIDEETGETKIVISKLSKRHGAVSFADLVNDGYLPEAIVNYIALLGWCPKGEESEKEFFTPEELRAAFSVSAINKSPAVFDYDKLLYFNGEYIKRLPDGEFLAKAENFLKSEIPLHISKEKMLLLLHGRIQKFTEIEDKIGFFLALPDYESALFFNKKNKVSEELAKEILVKAIPALEAVDTWNNDTLYAALLALAEEMGVKSGAVLWCLRIAAAGLAVTPGGATEIMEVLGKEETLRRLAIGAQK